MRGGPKRLTVSPPDKVAPDKDVRDGGLARGFGQHELHDVTVVCNEGTETRMTGGTELKRTGAERARQSEHEPQSVARFRKCEQNGVTSVLDLENKGVKK